MRAYLRVRAGNDTAMSAGPAGYETKDMGNEELRIVIKDNSIIIAGKRPWGSLYGVYTFFEEFIVISYLTPDHTYYPACGKRQYCRPCRYLV